MHGNIPCLLCCSFWQNTFFQLPFLFFEVHCLIFFFSTQIFQWSDWNCWYELAKKRRTLIEDLLNERDDVPLCTNQTLTILDTMTNASNHLFNNFTNFWNLSIWNENILKQSLALITVVLIEISRSIIECLHVCLAQNVHHCWRNTWQQCTAPVSSPINNYPTCSINQSN